jgi:hypothetical protein
LSFDLSLDMVFWDVHITIVLLVIQKNMVIEHYGFSILPILIPLLNHECDSLATWVWDKLKRLAVPIHIWGTFGVLNIHPRVNMHKLDLCAIQHSLSSLELDPPIIVHFLLVNSFLQHIEFVFVSSDFIVRKFLLLLTITLF